MICRVGERAHAGRAVDLPASLDPERVVRAVRTGAATSADPPITVDARAPGRLHERVGYVHEDLSLTPRTALAVAARSRGWTTGYDDRLREARGALAAHVDVPASPPASSRQQVAEAREEVDRLRERVAAARGRVEAADGEAPADRERLADAIRALSEVETDAAAARERRRRDREATRAARDELQERLRLEDRVANLERRARRVLVERARPAYERALDAVPGCAPGTAPFETAPEAMALAIARFGDLRAPAVLATGRFSDATAAAAWLDAPVVRLEP